jgi:alpha-tubulin suppressor-like RCC1 family protein
VVAPAAVVDATAYPKLTSASLTVHLAKQKAALKLSATTAYRDQPVTATLTLSPIREGWPVQLQVKSGSTWKAVGPAAAEDDAGRATVTVPTTASGTRYYRALKVAGKGVAAKASAAVKLVVKAPTLTGANVGTGWAHSCVVTRAGAVKCWGNNDDGQLGNNDDAMSAKPVQVVGLASGVVAVGGGGDHTCALGSTGTVWCWGTQTANGQSGRTAVPAEVPGLHAGARALAVGEYSSCVVTTVGGVECWGLGPLGDGSTDQSATPVVVAGVSDAIGVAVGANHACAVTGDGAVRCWGQNSFGQLGDGTTTDAATPVTVAGLPSKAVAVAAGGSFTCAVLDTGGAGCWGVGAYGRLGNGDTASSSVPVTVALPGPVSALDAGGTFACAIGAGTAWCWGSNGMMQLGRANPQASAVPVAVAVKGVKSLSAGGTAASGGHVCAVLYSGGVSCWGWGYHGQLGDGNTRPASSPGSLPVGVLGFR